MVHPYDLWTALSSSARLNGWRIDRGKTPTWIQMVEAFEASVSQATPVSTLLFAVIS
jgi:hypothetical protein